MRRHCWWFKRLTRIRYFELIPFWKVSLFSWIWAHWWASFGEAKEGFLSWGYSSSLLAHICVLCCFGRRVGIFLGLSHDDSRAGLCFSPCESLGEGIGNPCSILAWRIPWTEEPGGLQTMGSQRIRHDWIANIQTHTLQPTVLTWRMKSWDLGVSWTQEQIGRETPRFSASSQCVMLLTTNVGEITGYGRF